MEKYIKLIRATLLALVVALAGCGDRPIDLYLYGAANSCFPAENSSTCSKLKLYDKVDLKLLIEKQEVSYVQKGVELDASNTVFRTLSNCKIIDQKNFSCDGLVSVDGRFTDTAVFRNLYVSRALMPYWYAYYLSKPIKRSTLGFMDRHESWILPTVIIFAVLAFLGAAS